MIDPAHWGWPQWLYLAAVLVGVGVSMSKHGEPRSGHENFFVSMVASLLVLAVLTAGGFFR